MAKIVSKDLREKISKRLPGLNDNEAYWGLLEYLLFSQFKDRYSKELVLSSKVLSVIEGKQVQHSHNNYSARRFLGGFERATGIGIVLSDYRFVEGKARTVLSAGIPVEIVEACENELRIPLSQRGALVDFRSGVRSTSASRSLEDKELIGQVQSDWSESMATARKVIEYHNSLPVRRFSELFSARKNRAWEWVESNTVSGTGTRKHCEVFFESIEAHPKPILGFNPNRPRAVHLHPSFAGLKRGAREVLLAPFVQFDLKVAQLAFAAMEWELGDVAEFLQNSANPWRDISIGMGCPEADKGSVKNFVYALLFGATMGGLEGRNSALKDALERLPGKPSLDEVRGYPMIDSLYRARQGEIKMLAFSSGVRGTREQRLRSARSQMAIQMQEIEQELMMPIYQLADTPEGRRNFTIVVYMYDGVAVHFHHQRSWKKWHAEIRRVVDEKAKEMGVMTCLQATPGTEFKWS